MNRYILKLNLQETEEKYLIYILTKCERKSISYNSKCKGSPVTGPGGPMG